MRGDWLVMLIGAVSAEAAAQRPAPVAPLQRPAPVVSSMPALSQQGIARAHILCLLVDPAGPRPRQEQALCAQVRRLAQRGATVPVDAIGFGDPAILQPDALGVLVHVAIDRSGARPQAVIAIRPHRNARNATTFFGATPAVAPLGPDGAIPDAAIAAALDQVLPWRMRAPR